MNAKTLIGSAFAVGLLGLGVLAGSVAGSGGASAQTPSTTPTPSTTNPSAPTNPPMDIPGGPGGRGMHDGGFGGPDFGMGHGGMGATSANATQQISNTTSLITLVKSDLAYATGKMDTADVQRWTDGADALLKSAQTANSNSQYGQAVAYAEAARELAMTADLKMAQTLGADKLPSYSQMPMRGDKGLPTIATVTQAQASFMLANTYNRLVAQTALVKNSSQAMPYLTDAQNAYKTAYDAYQVGKYSDAVTSTRLAEKLAGVAGEIAQAANAPANSDTPVTVPAPNF